MPESDSLQLPRPEIYREPTDSASFGVVEKPLSRFETCYNSATVRKTVIVILLAIAWEIGARLINNSLLFPTFSSTILAFVKGIVSGELLIKIWTSLQILLIGYTLGVAFAAVLTTFAVTTRVGADFLETLTAMFNPLPAIALLPIALIWFGLGNGSLIFVLVHSVVWAVALNTQSGFLSVSNTLRMVGRNYGLRGFPYIAKILIPAAFPSILTGLKVGWAFAWRTLIASELVFGVSSGSGGLGWYIYENSNILQISKVFAGLLTIIIIGLIVENLIFRTIERHSVRKWGMQA
ncbi:ABC transporter permease protein [Thiomonas sp. X19]|uniref:ABC transporter permease n=1 Tax=Thiomonas sp. X19 TaxID=1050370 RepID=UPI000B743554|nr:ABC transporter permease [Thiomonas sp. X19]SCC91403.1 ABC transporter permease protein [Thiomonas sp. X19]